MSRVREAAKHYYRMGKEHGDTEMYKKAEITEAWTDFQMALSAVQRDHENQLADARGEL